MVLSRKKLKDKLRSLLAVSESKTSAIDGKEDIVKQLESVRERLKEAKTKRPRPTRSKRKKKPPLDGEEAKQEKEEGGTEENGDDEARGGEKGSSENSAVTKEKRKKEKKEKRKKEKKENKKKNRKEEASNEEKGKGLIEDALQIAIGEKKSSLTFKKEKESSPEQKALESNPSINLAQR